MASTYEIPLSPNAQTLAVKLAGTTYQLTVLWRDDPSGGWILDLADNAGNPVISGMALVTGADLLAQYAHLELGFALYVQSDNDPTAPPTYADLGVSAHLYAVW
jgi:hypothetical protein